MIYYEKAEKNLRDQADIVMGQMKVVRFEKKNGVE